MLPLRLWRFKVYFFLVVLCAFGGATLYQYFNFNFINQAGEFYLTMVEGVRAKNYYISCRVGMLNAIALGGLDDSILTSSGMASLSSHLLEQNMLVTSLNYQIPYLLGQRPQMWRFYPSLMTPIFPSKYTSLNLLNYLSIANSYNYEAMGYSLTEIHSNYALLRSTNDWMMTSTNTAIRDLINSPFKGQTLGSLNTNTYVYEGLFGGLLLLAFGFGVAAIIELKRRSNVKQRYYSALTTIPEKVLELNVDECFSAMGFLEVIHLFIQHIKKESVTNCDGTIEGIKANLNSTIQRSPKTILPK